MPWNPAPEVAVARDAAKKLHDAAQCIIIYRYDWNKLGMATYGKTRELCSRTGKIGDELFKLAMEIFADQE